MMAPLFVLSATLCLFTGALSAQSQSYKCPNEDALITKFNQVSQTLKVKGHEGQICHMHNYHGHSGGHDDHNNRDEDDHDENHNSTNCSSCDTVYKLCRTVILSLNLTTTDCLEEHNHYSNTTESSHPSSVQVYGYGFLMIFFVSLCSLVGVFLVPLMNSQSKFGRKTYKYVYAFMVAVGISALLSDAVLHLIPHSFGLHAHHEEEGAHHRDDHAEEESESEEFLWKACIILLGVYAFYLLEVALHGICDCKKKITLGHIYAINKPASEDILPEMKEIKNEENIKHYDIIVNGQQQAEDQQSAVDFDQSFPKRMKPVAWLIIIGDATHNFADGLALGAAIVQSLTLGISTMLALVFHEIPHELGDYVILIKSGMHWGIALLLNFLSSLTAIIGFFAGVTISSSNEEARSWILALTAGLFLYISLTDLLPELIRDENHDMTTTGWCFRALKFSFVNLGFYISFVLLLILAIYEESLNKLIK